MNELREYNLEEIWVGLGQVDFISCMRTKTMNSNLSSIVCLFYLCRRSFPEVITTSGMSHLSLRPLHPVQKKT